MRRPRRLEQPSRAVEATLEIERLGTDGAGLARYDGRILAVPGTLPGERVVVRIGGATRVDLLEVLIASPERVPPACRHFDRCGGCTAQHLAPSTYRAFKHARVTDALARVGLGSADVVATRESPPASRRRATLEAVHEPSGLMLGFHETAAHRIVDLADCPIMRPELLAALPAFRALFGLLLAPGRRGSLFLTLARNGIDAGLRLPGLPDLAQTEILAEFAEAHDLARLWVADGTLPPFPIAARRAPIVRPGGIAIEPPMGGFLQATEAGEAALVALVSESLAGVARVADLFSGIGTFALPLAARGACVHAVESAATALAALDRARRAAGLSDVTIERRDLDARPLLPHELARFDAVVFDPPRAGAKHQTDAIAASGLRTAIGVSCDPATFARDAACLVAAGFTLERVTPVDQFLWSSHIELVGVFRRGV